MEGGTGNSLTPFKVPGAPNPPSGRYASLRNLERGFPRPVQNRGDELGGSQK